MKKFKPTRMALVVAAVCAASPLLAQQAATDIGRINVEALPAGASTQLREQGAARFDQSHQQPLPGH